MYTTITRRWQNPVISFKGQLLEAYTTPTCYPSLPSTDVYLQFSSEHLGQAGVQGELTSNLVPGISVDNSCGCSDSSRLKGLGLNQKERVPGETRPPKSISRPLSSSPPRNLSWPHSDLPLVLFHLYAYGVELSSTPVLRV